MAGEQRLGPRGYGVLHVRAWEWLNLHLNHGLKISGSCRRWRGDRTATIYFLCPVHNRYLWMEERDFKRDPLCG
jgi:hypothetical protein